MTASAPRTGALLLLACACFGCATVEPAELVGGWEGSLRRGYTFVAPSFRTRVGGGDQGAQADGGDGSTTLLLTPVASYLYYDIPAADGATEVRSPGASLKLGVRHATPRISATLGAGYEVRDTDRRFPDGQRVHEDENGVITQADVFYQATPTVNLSTIASYSWANEYAWLRLGAKRQLTNFDYSDASTLHVGLEATAHGNNDVENGALGVVFEIAAGRSSLQLRTGYLHATSDGSSSDEIYIGLGFYRGF